MFFSDSQHSDVSTQHFVRITLFIASTTPEAKMSMCLDVAYFELFFEYGKREKMWERKARGICMVCEV